MTAQSWLRDLASPEAAGPWGTAGPQGAAEPPSGRNDPSGGGEPLDDGALIARSVRDPEQFAAVFRRRAPDIHRYVVRRIGTDAADDVVADTFLAAFRLRAAYHADRPDARPWLYGIATNLIGRHRRAEIRQYRALARTGLDPVTEPFTDQVDARVTARAASRQLAAALARLPAGHRDALLLVAWGDLTYEQTAAALGVPVGTVRSRVSRARDRLRQALAGADPSAPGSPATSRNGDAQ
jgi:RNA polymerase sigma factor (sigma-70 family)